MHTIIILTITKLTSRESSNGTALVTIPLISVVLADFLLRYNSYFNLLFVGTDSQRVTPKKFNLYTP